MVQRAREINKRTFVSSWLLRSCHLRFSSSSCTICSSRVSSSARMVRARSRSRLSSWTVGRYPFNLASSSRDCFECASESACHCAGCSRALHRRFNCWIFSTNSVIFTAFRALTLITTPPLPLAPQNALRALRFPACLCGTRVVFLLLKQFSSELEAEAEVILTLLIKLISGETDAGEPQPGWMRAPAMELRYVPLYTSFLAHRLTHSSICIYVCRLCSDAEFMRSVWQRCDTLGNRR
jgi:hypothetical protein